MIDLLLELRTPTLNEWQRLHWAQRREIGKSFAWAILAAYPQRRDPLKKCRIRIERTSPQQPDTDGLYGGLKPVLDALQPPSKQHPYGVGLIADDGPKCLLDLQAVHVKGSAKRTRVLIEEAA